MILVGFFNGLSVCSNRFQVDKARHHQEEQPTQTAELRVLQMGFGAENWAQESRKQSEKKPKGREVWRPIVILFFVSS